MFCFSKSNNGLTIDVKLPRFLIKRRHYYFNQYEVTYIRPNNHLKVEIRSNLPRVCEFNDYSNYSLNDYIGCTNGLGWKIKTIRIIKCHYVDL